MANLIRGGFFNKLKEREARLKLKLDQELQLEEAERASLNASSMPRLVEPVSVTETTTRKLETNERTSNT